ncbi:RNA-directed DNA polymerase, eukaryota, partial [Tanacetum coccineum]
EFSVASIRKLIDDKTLPSSDYITRWNKSVPIKVNVHAWKVMTSSLPTRFNIFRRGILIDSIICVNCEVGVESSGHLFFSCRMARDVSKLIACWWNVPFEDCDSYDEWLEWIDSVRLPKKADVGRCFLYLLVAPLVVPKQQDLQRYHSKEGVIF